jgi:hypothetical protein
MRDEWLEPAGRVGVRFLVESPPAGYAMAACKFSHLGRYPFLRLALAAALGAAFASGIGAPAAAQSAPQTQIPEKIEPPLPQQKEDSDKEKFQREDGVLKPPKDIDPGIETKPRDRSRTPVIPPPGTPGGDENVHPK